MSRSARIAPSSAEAASAAREGEGERREEAGRGGEVSAAVAVTETSRLLLRCEERFVVVDCSWSVCFLHQIFFHIFRAYCVSMKDWLSLRDEEREKERESG